jgi:hypothetical protein
VQPVRHAQASGLQTSIQASLSSSGLGRKRLPYPTGGLQLSAEAPQRAGADDTDLINQLQNIVTSFDVHHDKLFNLEEFSNLMLQLIQRSAAVRRKQIADDQ